MNQSSLDIAREAIVAARRAIRQIRRTTNKFDEARDICDKAEQQATDALAKIAALSQPVADELELFKRWYASTCPDGLKWPDGYYDQTEDGKFEREWVQYRLEGWQAGRASRPAIQEPLTTAQAVEPILCEECNDTCVAHNPGVCGTCYAMKYRDAAPVPQASGQQEWNAAIEAAALECERLMPESESRNAIAATHECAAAIRALLKSQKDAAISQKEN